MTSKIRITMSDGSIWEMKADEIARDRAKHYAYIDFPRLDHEESDYFLNRLNTLEEEFRIGMGDSLELMDWFVGNYSWGDIKDSLTMIKSPDQVDYSVMFIDAEKDLIVEDENDSDNS